MIVGSNLFLFHFNLFPMFGLRSSICFGAWLDHQKSLVGATPIYS